MTQSNGEFRWALNSSASSASDAIGAGSVRGTNGGGPDDTGAGSAVAATSPYAAAIAARSSPGNPDAASRTASRVAAPVRPACFTAILTARSRRAKSSAAKTAVTARTVASTRPRLRAVRSSQPRPARTSFFSGRKSSASAASSNSGPSSGSVSSVRLTCRNARSATVDGAAGSSRT
ncbi:hypothetical protein BJF79_12295 [Actinomadura sp. CNU-125]|nr:hypothetical protein BJF79_12295 [Actinomadura sp. CNU-125]